MRNEMDESYRETYEGIFCQQSVPLVQDLDYQIKFGVGWKEMWIMYSKETLLRYMIIQHPDFRFKIKSIKDFEKDLLEKDGMDSVLEHFMDAEWRG